MQELILYIIDKLEQLKVRYEIHSFDSGTKMIDIWLGDKFYVIQIDNAMLGLSSITAENISFDTRPDESFIDIVHFKNRFESILNNIIVQ